MTTTPLDLLRLAGRLVAAPSADQAQFRAAISRAYYSAFHGAADFLARIGLRVGYNHGELQRTLSACGVAEAQSAGRRLTDLHSFRIKADYDLKSPETETRNIAQQCVELASDILAIVAKLDTDANRPQIKAGIEAYRRKIGRAP